MIGDVTEHTMLIHGEQRHTITDAIEAAPGLVVFRMPADQSLNSAARWRIGHHEGRAIAEAMCRENAFKGADVLTASGIDWTLDEDTLKATITDAVARDLYAKLSYAWWGANLEPSADAVLKAEKVRSDADIEAAAAEYKADGYNALHILNAMSHTVPWMGLDTNDFNEAHDRICRAAGAE